MIYTDDKIRQVFANFFPIWKNNIDAIWVGYIYRIFHKNGFFYYEGEDDEKEIIHKMNLVSVMYYEFIYRTGLRESTNFIAWTDEQIRLIQDELKKCTEEKYIEISDAVHEFFGSDDEVFGEMYINALQGSEGLIRTSVELIELKDKCLKDVYENPNEIFMKEGYDLISNATDVRDFSSLIGL